MAAGWPATIGSFVLRWFCRSVGVVVAGIMLVEAVVARTAAGRLADLATASFALAWVVVFSLFIGWVRRHNANDWTPGRARGSRRLPTPGGSPVPRGPARIPRRPATTSRP